MLINNAAITMSSQHQFVQRRSATMSMRYWVGNAPPPAPDSANQPIRIDLPVQGNGPSLESFAANLRPPVRDEITISPQARKQQRAMNDVCGCTNKKSAADKISDPVTRMVVMLLEKVLGTKYKILDMEGESGDVPDAPPPTESDAPAQPSGERAGWGFEMRVDESYFEAEQMSFMAHGSIQTQDGKSIRFNLQLAMSREYVAQNSLHIRMGDALTDPLVINFDGTAAQLSNQRFQFDLNGDGEAESIHFPTPASGFLALDKDGDGKISRGAELFGPTTGDGFGELTAYDEDGNGWIDSNDAVFDRLRVLVQQGNGQQLHTLSEKEVGALYLNPINSRFTMKDQQNETLAQVAQSSIFVKENGDVGSLQRIDLAT